jgi:hypothetical protein
VIASVKAQSGQVLVREALGAVAVPPDLGVSASKSDLGRLNNSAKVLIVESWVHHGITD